MSSVENVELPRLLAGLSPAELEGHRYGELLHPGDVPVATEAFGQVVAEGSAPARWLEPII